MTKVKFSIFFVTLFILINIIVTLNTDGFCTIEETYTEMEEFIETFKTREPITSKCKNVFGMETSKTCYDYKEYVINHPVVKHLTKTRTRRQCCDGYLPKEGSCIPLCFNKCINSHCTGPDECTCDPGYEPTLNGHRCKLKCDEHYKYNEVSQNCDAVCTVPCLNGLCSEPDICTCSSGYYKNDKGICIKNECDPETTRNNECPYGICTSNGVCICNEGFAKNESNLKCVPVCRQCINGICVAPNKCICNNGFEWNDFESKCLPKCADGCLNGNCVAPDDCVCNTGYKSLNSSTCSPICNNTCVFGTCSEPNECTCLVGYQLRNESKHICAPICSLECINGYCYAPGLCQCYDGYNLSTSHSTEEVSSCTNCTTTTIWNICDPVCNSCSKNECIKPGICNHTNEYSRESSISPTVLKANYNIWIVVGIVLIVTCIISIIAYRRYFRQISHYITGSYQYPDFIDYGDDNLL